MHQLSPTELNEWLQDHKDIMLIDIREDWEREVFNIGGVHIPMGDLIARLSEIPKDRDVVLYCEKGIRSTIAIQRLEGMGYDKLYNLSGGVSKIKK